MRVAIDARLVTYQRAGIGSYVLGLLGGLRRLLRPDQLLVLTSRKESDAGALFGSVPRRSLWTPPHHRLEQLGLALEVAFVPADVHHAPDFIPPLIRRTPAVITVHDLYFLRDPSVLTEDSRRYYRQIGLAVRSADRIIAVSASTRRDLIDLTPAPSDKIDVIHEAADSRFRPAPAQEIEDCRAGLHLDREYFLFVGTREPRKNLTRLLKAYASIGSELQAPDLAVVGASGWLSDDLAEEARRLGITTRVHWLGRQPPEDLVRLYSGAVALAFPSLYEGFGLPAIEAMACGTPVLAGNQGALPEVAGDAALLVDPLDVDAIRGGLRRLWREPRLREELRGRGLERSARYSWDQAATETLDVYRRVA